ncbi:MAG: hypothetical protein A2Y12_17115 [Planctomycetes bacterium GWF2_42_9]|nr:MAG: hypothetical protein A2Y12_17115 [Planctomycetes bacterium GWF2_42_9]
MFTSVKANKVQNDLIKLIRNYRLNSGAKLPSERELAEKLGVCHLTVRKGLKALVNEGIIVKQPRVGNYIKEVAPFHALTQITIVVPHWLAEGLLHQPNVSLILSGVNSVFKSHDSLVNTITFRQGFFWEDAGQLIVDRHSDGVILHVDSSVSRQDIQRLMNAGVKVVLLTHEPHLAGMGLVQVDIDRGMVMAEILDKLVGLGHRRIIVLDYTETPYIAENIQIIDAIAKSAGIGSVNEVLVYIPTHDGKFDLSVLSGIFDRGPTAIIAPDEYIVSELFRLCDSHGLKVPVDISLASIVDMTPHIHPVPVTASNSLESIKDFAKSAAEYLLHSLKGDDVKERAVKIRCEVQWRKSVGPANQ